jgi:hypothetical protein
MYPASNTNTKVTKPKTFELGRPLPSTERMTNSILSRIAERAAFVLFFPGNRSNFLIPLLQAVPVPAVLLSRRKSMKCEGGVEVWGKGQQRRREESFWDIISANRVFANSDHVMGGSFFFFFCFCYFCFNTHCARGFLAWGVKEVHIWRVAGMVEERGMEVR